MAYLADVFAIFDSTTQALKTFKPRDPYNLLEGRTEVKSTFIVIQQPNTGDYLIGTENPNSSRAGQVSFPGGKVENFETWRDACHRELTEETGFRVKAHV